MHVYEHLFLLIYCLMYSPFFVVVLYLSYFGVHYFVFFLVSIILMRKRVPVALRMFCYCKCSVAFPHGAMGWSAVCDCGVSLSYSLFYISNMFSEFQVLVKFFQKDS